MCFNGACYPDPALYDDGFFGHLKVIPTPAPTTSSPTTLAPVAPTRLPTPAPTLSPRNADDDYAFFVYNDVQSVVTSIQQASLAATRIANATTSLLTRYGIGLGNAALTNTLVAGANAAAHYAATLASNQTAALSNVVATWKAGHGCNGGVSCTNTLVATSASVGLTFFNGINNLEKVISPPHASPI